MDKIRVTGLSDDGRTARVTVNGRSVKVMGYNISHRAFDIPEVTLYGNADVVLEECGEVKWVALPAAIDEAISVLGRAIADGKIDNTELAKRLGAEVNRVKRNV